MRRSNNKKALTKSRSKINCRCWNILEDNQNKELKHHADDNIVNLIGYLRLFFTSSVLQTLTVSYAIRPLVTWAPPSFLLRKHKWNRFVNTEIPQAINDFTYELLQREAWIFLKKGNENWMSERSFCGSRVIEEQQTSTHRESREFDFNKELTFQSVSAFLPYSSHPCCSWSGCRLLITDRRIFLNNKKSRHQSRIIEIRSISTRWNT